VDEVPVGLADAKGELRGELNKTLAEGDGEAMRFRLGDGAGVRLGGEARGRRAG
jgi:hypothetical protein